MSLRLYQVDAFTDVPFAGNPAAVVLAPAEPDAAWMQKLAEENNLSETAFVWPHEDHDGFGLRWFTPAVEVNLCGHATLASAHVLWETEMLDASSPARFWTKSGPLTCRRGTRIEMDFPARLSPAVAADGPAAEVAARLVDALGAEPTFVGKNEDDYLVVYQTEAEVRRLTPDLGRLGRCGGRGTIVTASSSSSTYDFVSRFFAPAAGVDEDPVTGSAHCALTPYWADRLGRTKMIGFQASARGGTVHVSLRGDRVLLGGDAVTVLRGELVAAACAWPAPRA